MISQQPTQRGLIFKTFCEQKLSANTVHKISEVIAKRSNKDEACKMAIEIINSCKTEEEMIGKIREKMS